MAARRARRWWRWPLYGLGALAALVLVLAIALQTSWAREQVRNQVNAALQPLFQGRIQIDRIGRLGLWGVSGVDARIFDPNGKQVIRAQGLEARAALPALAWQLLFSDAGPLLTIDRVRIDYTDVTLREDEQLGVTLATTFEPAETDEPPSAEDGESSPELHLPEIELTRVWAHGRVAGSPGLDADLLELRAALRQSPSGFGLDLRSTELVTRALPGESEPRGKLWGSIEVPAEPERPLRLEGFLDGRAAGSPLWLEATWVGDDLYAQVRLPRLPADYVTGQVSGLALQGELSVLAEAQGTLPELQLLTDVQGEAGHVVVDGHAFLSDGLEAVVSVAASGVDLAGVVADAPPSKLSAQLDALLLERVEGELELAHRLEVGGATVADVSTPPVTMAGELRLPATGILHASGTWQVAEPGASLAGRYRSRVGGDDDDDFVAVSLSGTLSDPPRAAALGITTAGTIAGEAELWLDSELLKARVDLSLRRFQYQASGSAPPLQTRALEARAQLSGSLDDPRAHAAATADIWSGRAHVDLDYSARKQEASAFVADIDLHRLAALLGKPLPFEQGTLNADFVARRAGSSNQPVELDGKLRANFGDAGQVELTATSLRVPSSLQGAAALSNLSGELAARGKLELARANRLSRMVGFPLERTAGTVRFELTGERREGGTPELALLLDTHGLRIVERREPRASITTTAEAVDNAPFALEGVDAHVALRFAPHTGEAVATVITRDRRGTLVLVEAEAELGKDWISRLSEPHALLATPLRAHVEIPERRLQTLPAMVRPPGLRGRVALDAELAGSLLEPRVRGWLELERLRMQRGNDPIALRANFRYEKRDGELFARASGSRGEDLARVTARWQGDLLRAHAAAQPALVASADAELFGLPLEVLPVLAEQQLKGRLVGHARLRDWGKNATLEARFEGRDIKVGTSELPSLLLAAECRDDKLLAELGLSTGKGSAKARLEAEARWGARALPELERRGVAKLSTQRFELATFSPLLGAYLSELSGVLDAEAQVAVDGEDTRVAGSASLTRGVVQVPAIGQRFSDIEAKVSVGDNQFKLRQLTARGTTGKLSATGSASLDGFALRSAELRASIAKSEALPVTIEGAALGDAWGNLKVTYASPPTGERRLDVNVPEFHLVTPDAGGASLQELDSAEEIRIGTRRADGTFVALPVQPLEPSTEKPGADEQPAQPLRVRVILGNNVTVARGAAAQAQLTGQLVVLSARETSVTGRIEIRGGKLDVQGKTFEIERGVVTFDGKDPSNPTITATARWDAPEHTVYAEYVGDVETGRIKLRAEPPLTQDQIASLLLFGDPDGSRGGSDPDAAALAVSVAGDTAAKGLNKALSDFTSLDVRARVDTTTGSARPELALQVSPRVAAKVTRAIGEPAVGESPDRTFLTLELRLRRGWALSALLGDRGASALDLIWRHRY